MDAMHNTSELISPEMVTATVDVGNHFRQETSQSSKAMIYLVTSISSSVLSIGLNTLNVLVACSTHFKLPISNCVAIVSMSLADMMLGLTTIIRFMFGAWTQYICRIHLIISVTSVRVSVVSLILIILDRYVAIVYPFHHHRYATRKFCVILVLVAWVITALANVVENATGNYFYDPIRRICDVQLSLTRVVVSSTLIYFIPLIMMLLIYAHLFVVVRRKIRETARIQPNSVSTTKKDQATNSIELNPIELRRNQEERENSQNDHSGQYKLMLTFFAVTTAFTVTTIPNRIVRLITLYQGPLSVSFEVTLFARILVISGSWLNFVIFSVMNQNFRCALKHIFKRRSCGRRY